MCDNSSSKEIKWDSDESLDAVLTRLLSKVHLKHERVDDENYLILGESRKVNSLDHNGEAGSAGAQAERGVGDQKVNEHKQPVSHAVFGVDGFVRQENDDPLPGVNVIVREQHWERPPMQTVFSK